MASLCSAAIAPSSRKKRVTPISKSLRSACASLIVGVQVLRVSPRVLHVQLEHSPPYAARDAAFFVALEVDTGVGTQRGENARDYRLVDLHVAQLAQWIARLRTVLFRVEPGLERTLLIVVNLLRHALRPLCKLEECQSTRAC